MDSFHHKLQHFCFLCSMCFKDKMRLHGIHKFLRNNWFLSELVAKFKKILLGNVLSEKPGHFLFPYQQHAKLLLEMLIIIQAEC